MTSPTLTTRIPNKVAPHVRSEPEQRALLDSALYGFDRVRSKIPVGQAANIFSITCVTTLLEYGRLPDGTHPLSRVLATLHDGLGVDPEWDQLIAEVEASSRARSVVAETALPTEQAIRDVLVSRFSLTELQTLAFDLGIDREEIPGSTKGEFAREFVTYCARRGRLNALVEAIRRERPGSL